MPEFPILETERLILRAPQEVDLDGFAAMLADEQSARFIGGLQPRPAAWRGMASLAGSWVLKGFSMFSVIEKSSGAWIGRIGPWAPEGWPGTEVGWGLLRPYWGRSYAYEAAIASIDWAFATLGWSEVIHTIASDNAPSKAWPPGSARATCAKAACRRRSTSSSGGLGPNKGRVAGAAPLDP